MHSHFVLFLRLIQESDPLEVLRWLQHHPGRCAFSIDDVLKSVVVMEIQDKHLLRGSASNSAVYHWEDSVSMVNILVWMPPEDKTNSKCTEAKGCRG